MIVRRRRRWVLTTKFSNEYNASRECFPRWTGVIFFFSIVYYLFVPFVETFYERKEKKRSVAICYAYPIAWTCYRSISGKKERTDKVESTKFIRKDLSTVRMIRVLLTEGTTERWRTKLVTGRYTSGNVTNFVTDERILRYRTLISKERANSRIPLNRDNDVERVNDRSENRIVSTRYIYRYIFWNYEKRGFAGKRAVKINFSLKFHQFGGA